MKTFTLEQFAHFLSDAAMIKQLEHGEHVALEWIGQIVEAEAKSAIGTYRYGWEPLKEATIAHKAHGDTPLLETGELRDSIEHTVGDHEVQIGSNNDKALWHELGTRTIPPRSFLVSAAKEKLPEIKEVTKIAIGAAIASRSIEAEIARLAIDAVKHVARDVKEMIPDEDNEHQRKRH